MRVEPAHIDQIRRASNGRMLLIDKDVGGVAEDLRAIDPGLKVRFAENGNPPFFAVYHESEDRRTTYLVLTQTAHQTASGTWSGLDQRIVDRVRQIGDESYDFASEVERQNRQAHESRRQEFRERIGETAEQAAFAVRKDTGARYKGRAFVPKGLRG